MGGSTPWWGTAIATAVALIANVAIAFFGFRGVRATASDAEKRERRMRHLQRFDDELDKKIESYRSIALSILVEIRRLDLAVQGHVFKRTSEEMIEFWEELDLNISLHVPDDGAVDVVLRKLVVEFVALDSIRRRLGDRSPERIKESEEFKLRMSNLRGLCGILRQSIRAEIKIEKHLRLEIEQGEVGFENESDARVKYLKMVNNSAKGDMLELLTLGKADSLP